MAEVTRRQLLAAILGALGLGWLVQADDRKGAAAPIAPAGGADTGDVLVVASDERRRLDDERLAISAVVIEQGGQLAVDPESGLKFYDQA